MQKLIDINDGKLLERGAWPSLAPNQKELWKTSTNIEFRDRRAVKALGFTVQVITSTSVVAIAQAFVDGEKRAYWAENNDVFVSVDGVGTHIGGPWPGQGYWSLEVWGTWLLATNQEEPVKVWKNAGTMVDLGGFTGIREGRRYKIIKKHKNHMLGYFDQRVDWSHESDVEQWEPSTINSAGGFDLRDLDSDIVAVVPLGEDMAIYSSDHLVRQTYAGEPFYFTFRPAIDGVGAVGENSVISVSNKNYGMSKKGFFVTDGFSYEPIDNPQINEYVYGVEGEADNLTRFDQANGRRVASVHDEKNTTVKWWYPCMDMVRRGVAYNYRSGAWSPLEQPITAAHNHEVFDAPIVGTPTSLGFNSGTNFGALPQPATLTTFPLDAGDREIYKLWDLYRVDGQVLDDVEVRFGFQDRLKAAIEWTDWAPLTEENFINRESVFLTIELRSTGVDVPWRLEGFSVHGERTGYL